MILQKLKPSHLFIHSILYPCFILICDVVFSQAPAGFYASARGKTGAELKTALSQIIREHKACSYDAIWDYFAHTDCDSNGHISDIYSSCRFEQGRDQCRKGPYSPECRCYNREHSMPKSWFNGAMPMFTDLHMIFPSDGYVNLMKKNYPPGKVSHVIYVSGNGSKIGINAIPGYSGKAFEPADEYKGDFARAFFYMVTCYETEVAAWEKNDPYADAVLDGTSYPCFEQWFIKMLLDWHKKDPVSRKEIHRNNIIFLFIQKNRNPFIDYPEFAPLIWNTSSYGKEVTPGDTIILFSHPRP